MNIFNILKKSVFIIALALLLCAGIGAGNGVCGDESDEAKILTKEEQVSSTAESVKNFRCPVSDDDIDKANCIKIEYKGKIYNLCCDACAKHFIKHPEKFSQIATSPR
ncbi:MAG: hypothetical protein NTY76_06410 [Candidatus Omnitrophica bacterium]|nr:hypothetical protein [Candidatus Omnitrophota bacterium]